MKIAGWVLVAALGGASLPMAARAQDHAEISVPQAELTRQDLVITGADKVPHLFSVEVASTPKQQEVGEMFRTDVPAARGMLFVWPYPQESAMWMKNTLVPLDIVFIGANGTINAIDENTVPRSLAQIAGHGPVVATLELRGGVTAALGIRVGDKVASKALPQKS